MTPDVNVLIAAFRRDHQHHAVALEARACLAPRGAQAGAAADGDRRLSSPGHQSTGLHRTRFDPGYRDVRRRPARLARSSHSIPDRIVAIPRKLKKPTMSVTVVMMIDDDCAGSRPTDVRTIGMHSPTNLNLFNVLEGTGWRFRFRAGARSIARVGRSDARRPVGHKQSAAGAVTITARETTCRP